MISALPDCPAIGFGRPTPLSSVHPSTGHDGRKQNIEHISGCFELFSTKGSRFPQHAVLAKASWMLEVASSLFKPTRRLAKLPSSSCGVLPRQKPDFRRPLRLARQRELQHARPRERPGRPGILRRAREVWREGPRSVNGNQDQPWPQFLHRVIRPDRKDCSAIDWIPSRNLVRSRQSSSLGMGIASDWPGSCRIPVVCFRGHSHRGRLLDRSVHG
jgi:hypothetical protein